MKSIPFIILISALLSGCATNFQWPAKGNVVSEFNETTNKGLDIGGQSGDPIYAAADGKISYVGSALKGYGNTIIIKHNAQYITSYSHLEKIFVVDSQNISKGEKIGEMGNSDTDRVKLHFEIRSNAIAVNPITLLPKQ